MHGLSIRRRPYHCPSAHLGDQPAALQQPLEKVECALALPAHHVACGRAHVARPAQAAKLLHQLLHQVYIIPEQS